MGRTPSTPRRRRSVPRTPTERTDALLNGVAASRSMNEVEAVADPDLTDPVLIEGVPGVGHVGKLAAEHLIE